MDNNIKMIVKLHPLQTADTQGMELSHIKFITQDELNRSDMTVYTLLRNADGLITVSYTHLDVYKRQISKSRSHI